MALEEEDQAPVLMAFWKKTTQGKINLKDGLQIVSYNINYLFPLRTPRADVVREEADIPENIVV